MDEKPKENWGSGGPYEQYVGRWSRKVAKEFLTWLGVSPGRGECEPQSIKAIDRSEGFIVDEMRDRIRDALKARLVPNPDGTIAMVARAWAVRGAVPVTSPL